MMGTPDNEHPDAFAQADLDAATARVVELVRKHRPHVIVTYDENGFYGHPDHINAHRVAVGAFSLAGDPAHLSPSGLEPWQPAKLYYTAVARSAMAQFGAKLREAGIESPMEESSEIGAEERPWGTPDDLITTVVDVTPHVEQKRAALFAHATQMGPEVFFAKIPPALFGELFGQESFQLITSHVPVSTPESDLFDGLDQ
jgi:LmbE family N-acetylglucosaminyl deacetylase